MGVFSLSLQIGTMAEVDVSEANSFVQDFISGTQDSSGTDFFQNNIIAALQMFVPGIGVILGAHTAWSTGYGFAAIVSMAPGLAESSPLSVLYFTPFGLMELAAYSIAMSRSFHIVYVLVKRVKLKSLIKPTLIEIGVVFGLLFAGGYIEEYMIVLSQQGVPLSG